MTTIAWDGTTLAGDSLGIIGDNLKVHSQKCFALPDGRLYGGSGDYSEVLAVREWLHYGLVKPDNLKHFSGLVIEVNGNAYRLEERLVPLPVDAPHACGSGRDFAIAAMALGQTAEQAVALAMQFDPWTGGAIVTLTLKA